MFLYKEGDNLVADIGDMPLAATNVIFRDKTQQSLLKINIDGVTGVFNFEDNSIPYTALKEASAETLPYFKFGGDSIKTKIEELFASFSGSEGYPPDEIYLTLNDDQQITIKTPNGASSVPVLDSSAKLEYSILPTSKEVGNVVSYSSRGETNGVAPLDSDARLPTSYLYGNVANGVLVLDGSGYIPSEFIHAADTVRFATQTIPDTELKEGVVFGDVGGPQLYMCHLDADGPGSFLVGIIGSNWDYVTGSAYNSGADYGTGSIIFFGRDTSGDVRGCISFRASDSASSEPPERIKIEGSGKTIFYGDIELDTNLTIFQNSNHTDPVHDYMSDGNYYRGTKPNRLYDATAGSYSIYRNTDTPGTSIASFSIDAVNKIGYINNNVIYHTGNDSALVHIAGTETITGAKTFSSTTSLSSIEVSGTSYVDGNFYVNGNLTLGNFHASHAVLYINRTGNQWSSFNYGTEFIIKGSSRHPSIGLFDSAETDPWAIVNKEGVLTFSVMPNLGDTTSSPTEVFSISNTTYRALFKGGIDVKDDDGSYGLETDQIVGVVDDIDVDIASRRRGGMFYHAPTGPTDDILVLFSPSNRSVYRQYGTGSYAEIWDSWNNGPGSGLNADLLDDQEGSYYLNASNINAGNLGITYMPTGGTWNLSSTLSINNQLFIDHANDRLGFDEAFPSVKFHFTESAVSGTNPTWDATQCFIIERNSHCALTIFTPDDKVGFIVFAKGTTGTGTQGEIRYDHLDDSMTFRTNNVDTERFRISFDGKLSTNDETDPDVDTGGLCLNINNTHPTAFTLKSSYVSHDFNEAESDTCFVIKTLQAEVSTKGGAVIQAFKEDSPFTSSSPSKTETLMIEGYCSHDTLDITSASDSRGVLNFYAYKYSSGLSALTDDENMVAFHNGGTTARIIFKGDGDIESYTGSISAYDSEDDISLVEAARFFGKNAVEMYDGWDKEIIKANRERLEELGILQNGFMSHNKIIALQLGAITQLYHKVKEQNTELRERLERLEKV